MRSDRPSGLLLAATWGSRSAPSSCTAYFVRSFVALPSPRRTELRILFDPSSLSPGEVWPCENEPPHDGLVTYVPIPEDWRRRLRVLGIWRNLDQYRVHLFNWLMQNMTASDLERYGYIGALDTDIIFQIDPFDAWHPQVRGRHELLLSAENPVDDNDGGQALAKLGIVRRAPGAESYLWSWEVKPSAMRPATSDKGKPSRAPASPPPPDCRYVYEVPPSPLHPAGVHRQPQVQADYWRLFGQTSRLNFGTLLGTRSAMVHLFDVFLRAVTRFKMNGKLSIGTAIYCHYGQAVLNALVYSGALQGTLTIGSYHRGLVKTVDVGGLRDAHGRFYNERGAPYALVHQFRRTRHPQFFEELERIFPSGLPDAAWRAVLFGRARQALLQRVPMVWDQAARYRMHNISERMKQQGVSDPSDPSSQLPTEVLAECGARGCPKPKAEWYSASAVRRDGIVSGLEDSARAWRAMFDKGYTWPHGDPHCGADRNGFNATHRLALSPISGRASTSESRKVALDAWPWGVWC